MAESAPVRIQFARGPVTDRVQAKLVKMMKASEGIETLVAEDIVEAMTIGRNDPEGFRAVDQFLNELTEKYEAIVNG
jgi:hypothetical protein